MSDVNEGLSGEAVDPADIERGRTDRAEPFERCGIKHGFGDQRCIREEGHEGICRSKAERGNGTLTYSEWQSKDGKFHSHHAYRTIYPKNSVR